MKVVINQCYGGFSLSPQAQLLLARRMGHTPTFYQTDRPLETGTSSRIDFSEAEGSFFFYVLTKDVGPKATDAQVNEFFFDQRGIARDNPLLIEIVEELGEDASGMCAELEVIEIPDDIEWYIDEYDGIETVREVGREWS